MTMNWVMLVWGMVMSACLTLALVHLLAWSQNHRARASLAFSAAATSVAGCAAFELAMMLAKTPEQFNLDIRYAGIVVLGMHAGLVAYVCLDFKAGNCWLAWSSVGLRVLAVVLAFTTGGSDIYREITALGSIELLGERVAVVSAAISNPWVHVNSFSSLLWIGFVIDASVRLWRRGGAENRRRAGVVGGSMILFLLFAAGLTGLQEYQIIRMPYFVALSFLPMILVIASELSRNLNQVASLAEEALRHERELAHMSRVSLVGELSGALVHELGQPLGALLANAETARLTLDAAPLDKKELIGILTDIQDDSLRAGGIVQGMHTFLRRQEVAFESVHLGTLFAEVEKLATPDAALRRAALTFAVAPGLPPVQGHRVQLQQVLLNLILNGLQAMEDCPPDERALHVTASDVEGNLVQISVMDSGKGLPAEKLNQIFTPFLTTKTTGLGMGLCICRRIVQAHNGRIWIENNQGPGATARFTLPIGTDGAVIRVQNS